jgi:hypothetical protein
LHAPENEPRFKVSPYIEIYLENMPRKNHITAVRIPFAELKKIIGRVQSLLGKDNRV